MQFVQYLAEIVSEGKYGSTKVDIPTVLGRGLLDSLGSAAFGHDFHCLDHQEDELADSLHQFM